jgi:hypothetical protein
MKAFIRSHRRTKPAKNAKKMRQEDIPQTLATDGYHTMLSASQDPAMVWKHMNPGFFAHSYPTPSKLKQQHSDSPYRTERRHSSLTPHRLRSVAADGINTTDSASEGGGSYSPPTSVSSWSPPPPHGEFLPPDPPPTVPPKDRLTIQTGLIRQRSKSLVYGRSSEDSMASDFEFLTISPVPEESPVDVVCQDMAITTAYLNARHQQLPKKKPSFEYRQYSGRMDRQTVSTVEVQDDVDAGIPPKVPRHRISLLPALELSPIQGPSEPSPTSPTKPGGWDMYTRKCSYVQRQNTVLAKTHQQTTNDGPVTELRRKGSIRRDTTGKWRAGSSSREDLGGNFVLPGYDQKTKLKVVNKGKDWPSVSNSSVDTVGLNPPTAKLTPTKGITVKRSNSRRIRFDEPKQTAVRRNISRKKKRVSVYDPYGDPYQHYFFGVDSTDGSSILDAMWAQRRESFLKRLC